MCLLTTWDHFNSIIKVKMSPFLCTEISNLAFKWNCFCNIFIFWKLFGSNIKFHVVPKYLRKWMKKGGKYFQVLNKIYRKRFWENCLILSSLSYGYNVLEIIFYGLLNEQSWDYAIWAAHFGILNVFFWLG